MARIRTIKPEFPQSETVGKLSRDARLLFMQLWTIADDEGRTRAASRMLASLLYPYDDDARKLMEGWLSQLDAAGCIRRYAVDGNAYLDIPNWAKHQKIDRPSKSRLPAFVEPSLQPREDSRDLDADLGPRTLDPDPLSVAPASRAEEAFEEFWKEYPKRDGENPRAPARKTFLAFVKAGVDPAAIVSGVRHCAVAQAAKVGTPYIPQAVKWLRDRRWEDHAQAARDAVLLPDIGFHAEPDSSELSAWDAFGREQTGKNYPRDKRGGWTFPTQWPPGFKEQAA